MKNVWKSNNKDFWYVCDFETTTINTEYYKKNNDVCVILANSLNWSTQEHTTFANIDDWINYHFNLNVSQTLFFHNLFFDGDFIIKKLLKIGFRITNSKIMKNKEILLFRQNKKIYIIKVRIEKRVGNKIVKFNIYIRDSLALLSSSVESLGKSFGIVKRKEDELNDTFYNREPKNNINEWFKNESDKRYVEYCRNDCLIVFKALKTLDDMINNLNVVKKSKYHKFSTFNQLTIGSISWRLIQFNSTIYNNKFKLKNKYLYVDKNVYDLLHLFFSGGFTQFNPNYQTQDPVYLDKWNVLMDVSSAYPYQMTKPLPFGSIYTKINDKWSDYYEFYIVKVKKAIIKKEYKHFAILKNWKGKDIKQRYVTELKNFECYYLKQEWETINKIYDIEIESIESFFMEAKPFLKDLENELYNSKSHFSKTKQDGLKLATKILLNASYGKFAQNPYKELYFYYADQKEHGEKVIENEKEYVINSESQIYSYGDFHCYKSNLKNLDKLKFKNIAAAAVITSLERVYLWETVIKFGVEHFLYSDTDSILMGNIDKQKRKLIEQFLTKNVLGGFENEFENQTIKYFRSYGAKKYELYDENKKAIKRKFAGINSKDVLNQLDKYSFDKDHIELNDACFRIIYCKSGLAFEKIDKIFTKGVI